MPRPAAVALLVFLTTLALLARAEEGGAAARGRTVYLREACWQCHVQAGDPSFPVVEGTRRTGPVLDRVAFVRSREWHLAHLLNPRAVSAGSVMPSYPRLFADDPRAAAVRAFVAAHDSRDGGMDQDGVVTRLEFARAGGSDEAWEAALAELDRGSGVVSLASARPRPTAALDDLVTYLRGLDSAPPAPEPVVPARPAGLDAAQAIARGERVFQRWCAGCHGTRADGNGPAAPFFPEHPPRNFLRGEFKFRSTPQPLPPTDADLFRTIRRGAGPSMPPWPDLPDAQVWDLVEFVKSNHPGYVPRELFVTDAAGAAVAAFVRGTDDEPPEVPDAAGLDLGAARLVKRAGRWFVVEEGRETPVVDGLEAAGHRFRLGAPVYDWMLDFTPEPLPLAERSPVPYTAASAEAGARVYAELGCAKCHGDEGRGDGPSATETRGSLGQVVRPSDYTRGPAYLKGGADDRSLVRAFLTGLHGTPMPSYRDSFPAVESAPPAEAPWHLAHFVLRQAGIPFDR